MTSNRTSLLAVPIVISVLLGSALIGNDRLAFRDVSFFYTPLYEYVAARTNEAWLPLWNPLDGNGMPLLGETTTAILYPLRIVIYGLPLPAEVAMSLYVAVHLLLAAVTAHFAARQWNASRAAARLAGVIYPLSGSVLFLYTNPPFLAGAAWMPLAIACLVGIRPMALVVRCGWAAAALAMMITAGDPQTALHTLLASFVLLLAQRRAPSRRPERAFVMIVASCFAAVLAAPQLAASIAWSRQSERVMQDDPQPWLAPPSAGSRRLESYQFSLPPWHLSELVTPRASGSLLPIHRRISGLVPGDGRMWTPSIYAGGITILVLIYFCLSRDCRRSRAVPWMWLAGVSLLLSLGQFGLVWWAQQIPGTLAGIDSAAGGLYWMLYHSLPGYDAFRYPTKWLPFFSLAAALTVSLAVDRATRDPRAIRYTALAAVVYAIMLLAAAVAVLWRWFAPEPSVLPADRFWGPLDLAGACCEIGISLAFSAIVLLAIVILWRLAVRHKWTSSARIHALVWIAAVDLGISGHWMIAKVNRVQEQSVLQSLPQPTIEPMPQRWMRTQTGGGWPAGWQQQVDSQRLMEVEASGKLAWIGRWHLTHRQPFFNNMVSIQSRDLANFWAASRTLTATMDDQDRDEYWARVRQWLCIDAVLHAGHQSKWLPTARGQRELVDVSYRTESKFPHEFRWSSTWSLVPEERTTLAFLEFLRTLHHSDSVPPSLIHADNPPDDPNWRTSSIPPSREHDVSTESGSANASDSPLSRSLLTPITSNRILHVTQPAAEHVVVEVSCTQPSLLVRSVYQDGAWRAELRERSIDPKTMDPHHDPLPTTGQWTPVQRVDFLNQGVFVPAGNWEIHFRYQPWWLPWSLFISGLGWTLWIAGMMLARGRKLRAIASRGDARTL